MQVCPETRFQQTKIKKQKIEKFGIISDQRAEIQ